MKIEKKHIVAAGIAGVSITAAAAYLQYKKLMNYCIGFKSIKSNTLSMNKVDVNVFLNFKNNSNVKIEIVSQEYQVYFNDKPIIKASNYATQTIQKESKSVIGVNVQFNPSAIGNVLNTVLSQSRVALKIEMKLKVKLWFFTVNIPYVYETTLKEILTPSAESKTESTMICK